MLYFVQYSPLIGGLSTRRHGRKPELSILHARTMVSPRFSSSSSLLKGTSQCKYGSVKTSEIRKQRTSSCLPWLKYPNAIAATRCLSLNECWWSYIEGYKIFTISKATSGLSCSLVVQHSSWLCSAPVSDNCFFFLCIFSSLLHPTFLFLRLRLVKGTTKQIQTKFATIFWKHLHFDWRHQVATAHAYSKGFSFEKTSICV